MAAPRLAAQQAGAVATSHIAISDPNLPIDAARTHAHVISTSVLAVFRAFSPPCRWRTYVYWLVLYQVQLMVSTSEKAFQNVYNTIEYMYMFSPARRAICLGACKMPHHDSPQSRKSLVRVRAIAITTPFF